MLNDNFIFLNHTDIPSKFYYDCNELHHSSRCTDLERDYIYHLAELEEQEHSRCYQAALREQAYLEALERKRKNRLLEERWNKQCLLELQHRQYQKEQEQKRRHQYLAHLEEKQQEKLRQEWIKARKTAAFEDFKRKEEKRRIFQIMNEINPLQQEIVDRNFYGIFLDPRNIKHKHCGRNILKKTSVRNLHTEPPSLVEKKIHRKNESSTNKMDCFKKDSSASSSKMQDATFTNSVNINGTINDQVPIMKSRKPKSMKKVPRKSSKPFVIVGDVVLEDASDSECEDEFNDYMHTRRPQTGEWIEPIESITSSVRF